MTIGSAIGPFVWAKFLAGLVGPFFRQIWATYKTVMGKAMAYLGVVAYRSFAAVAPEMAKNSLMNMFDHFLARDVDWMPAVTAYFEWLTGEPLPITEPEDYLKNTTEIIGQRFLGPMLNMVLPGGYPATETGQALKPQDGLDGAEKFLGANMRFQMQGWLMNYLADMFGLDQMKSIQNFPQNLSWAYGLGWLSWLVMGVPFRMAISDPLERYFNLRYRSKDLTLGQIADFYWTDPTFRTEGVQRLKEMGYTDDDIPRVLDRERRKLSKTELADFHDWVGLPSLDIWRELVSQGYGDAQAQVLTAQIVNQRSYDLIHKIADAAQRQYKANTISADTLRQYLAAANYKPDESELIIARLDLEKLEPPQAEPTPTGLTRGMIGGLYRDGERDRDWTVIKLTGLNWDPSEVDDFLDYYKPKAEKVPTPRKATAAMIGKLYKTLQITRAEAETLWAMVPVAPSDIPLYVKYYTPPTELPAGVAPPALLTPTSIAKLMQQGTIAYEEAVYLLGLLDASQEEAALFLSLYPVAEPAPLPDRPELTIWDIVTSVADGALGMADGVDRLVSRGWTQDEAVSYLRVQVAYQVALDVTSACAQGDITHAQAVASMVAAGWTPGDAVIYLETRGCTP